MVVWGRPPPPAPAHAAGASGGSKNEAGEGDAGVGEGLAAREVGALPIRAAHRLIGPAGRTCLHLLGAGASAHVHDCLLGEPGWTQGPSESGEPNRIRGDVTVKSRPSAGARPGLKGGDVNEVIKG